MRADPDDAPPPPARGAPQDQLTDLIRELLLTLRSLIDWYLERLDQRPREAREEDIPIE